MEVFFVLSGFVIAQSIRGERITARFAGNFFLRRSLRLDPPYWAVIAIFLSKFCITNGIVDVYQYWGWRALAANTFYVADLFHVRAAGEPIKFERILGISWTLALEIQFYIALLVVVAAWQKFEGNQRGQKSGKIAAFVLLAPMIAVSLYYWFVLNQWNFIGMWYAFSIGSILYWTLQGRFRSTWFLLYAAVILILGVFFDSIPALMVAATALVIFEAAKRGSLHRWLKSNVFQFLGRISYSIYLIHWPVGGYVMRLAIRKFGDPAHPLRAPLASFTLAILSTLISSYALYVLVERPSHRFAKRLKMPKARSNPYLADTSSMPGQL